MKIGATGNYPEGPLNEDDEGELAIAIAYDPAKNIVHINFGTPIAWLAMKPEQARAFAAAVIEKANWEIVHQPIRPFGPQ